MDPDQRLHRFLLSPFYTTISGNLLHIVLRLPAGRQRSASGRQSARFSSPTGTKSRLCTPGTSRVVLGQHDCPCRIAVPRSSRTRCMILRSDLLQLSAGQLHHGRDAGHGHPHAAADQRDRSIQKSENSATTAGRIRSSAASAMTSSLVARRRSYSAAGPQASCSGNDSPASENAATCQQADCCL